MQSLLVASAFACLCLPALGAELTLDSMHDLLRSGDAASVVQSLDDGGDWDVVLGHIERGEAGWVLLIPALAPGTEPGPAEGVPIALSRALRANPQAVLSLINAQYYSAADICLDNDIEVS